MNSKPELVVDWCSYKAAKYAVEHWHYSGSTPAAPASIGVWECSDFIGAILYARGAAMNIGKPYGLEQTQICELVRVALRDHKAPVSKIISISIRLVRSAWEGMRLIVSYADPAEGHNGGIYQALNWIYVGQSASKKQKIHGKLYHPRTVYSRYKRQDIGFLREFVDPGAEWVTVPSKHKYLCPLDRAMRRQIAPLSQPYPKKIMRPVNGDNSATSGVGRFDPDLDALKVEE